MKLKGYEAMGGLRQKEIMTNPPWILTLFTICIMYLLK
jgi:hypothetical protein